MKKIVLLLTLLLSVASFAGDKGNGGGVHLCPNKISMYDVFEAESRYGLDIYRGGVTTQDYINRAMAKVYNRAPFFHHVLQQNLAYLKSHLVIKDNIILTPVQDANILFVEEGCEYKQLANWDDLSGNILVQGKLFKKLSPLDEAAFYMHEAVYKMMRDAYGEVNSDLSRKMVGGMISDDSELGDVLVFGQSLYHSIVVAKDSPVGLQHEFDKKFNTLKLRYHLGQDSFYLYPSMKIKYKVNYSGLEDLEARFRTEKDPTMRDRIEGQIMVIKRGGASGEINKMEDSIWFYLLSDDQDEAHFSFRELNVGFFTLEPQYKTEIVFTLEVNNMVLKTYVVDGKEIDMDGKYDFKIGVVVSQDKLPVAP